MTIFNDFKRHYTSDQIEMQNPLLNKCTKNLDFMLVDNKANVSNAIKDTIHKRVMETDMIIIDHIKVATSYYFTICLSKLLIIISDSELAFFSSFLCDQKNLLFHYPEFHLI